jgi:CTP:molybdopterin cytidylyltransferase MocA
LSHRHPCRTVYDGCVTIAAVMLFPSVEGALADSAGRPAVRRMVESAWAGGATPIVVVAHEEAGRVAAALAGSPAVLAEPAPRRSGPIGQIMRGMDLAASQVTETDGALLWPGRMVWVDAETITTLIEAHGANRDAILRPRYADELGWPVLVPLSLRPQLAVLSAELMPDELIGELLRAGVHEREVDTGDPGTVLDQNTAIDDLPDYQGPPEPVGGPPPEWGATAAETSDEGPLEGPALAPYPQAAEEGD